MPISFLRATGFLTRPLRDVMSRSQLRDVLSIWFDRLYVLRALPASYLTRRCQVFGYNNRVCWARVWKDARLFHDCALAIGFQTLLRGELVVGS